MFFYSQGIFKKAGVLPEQIPYAIIGTNAVNVLMTIITVSHYNCNSNITVSHSYCNGNITVSHSYCNGNAAGKSLHTISYCIKVYHIAQNYNWETQIIYLNMPCYQMHTLNYKNSRALRSNTVIISAIVYYHSIICLKGHSHEKMHMFFWSDSA